MKKRIIAALLALTMVVSGIYFAKPAAEEVKASAASGISDTTEPNTADPDMLNIKMQNSEVYPNDGERVDLRIVSSVNGLGYENVGFEVWYDEDVTVNADGTVSIDEAKPTAKKVTKKVLKRVKAAGKVAYDFSPKVVDTAAEYFVTATIEGILTTNFDKNFYVRAFCTPLGGTAADRIYGAGKLFTIDEATAANNINIPVAMTEDQFATATAGGLKLDNVTIAGTTTTATVAGYIDGYAQLNVTVPNATYANKTALPSASKIVVGDASAIYRNLDTDYTGTGTEDTSWYDVYAKEGETEFVIATDADLYGFSSLSQSNNFSGATIYAVADIDANDGKGTASATEFTRSDSTTPYAWNPIGSISPGAVSNFAGTFDGQMHSVSGVCLSGSGSDVAGSWGLFGATGDCTIQNLTLENSYLGLSSISKSVNMGSIAGLSSGTFDTIKVENNVYLYNYGTNAEYTGGIVGTMGGTSENGSKINNCWFSGTITAHDYVGGILAYANDGTSTTASTLTKKAVEISNCLSSGVISLNKAQPILGGLCAYVNYSRVDISDSINVSSIQLNGYALNTTLTGSIIGWLCANPYGDTKDAVSTNKRYSAVLNNTYGTKGSEWKCGMFSNSKGSHTIDGVEHLGSVTHTAKLFYEPASLMGEVGYTTTMNLDFSVADDYTGYWTVTTETPVLSSFLNNEEVYDIQAITTPRTVWYVPETYADTDTYTLGTKADMYGFASLSSVDFAGKTVKLVADITLNEGDVDSEAFTPAEGTELIPWTPRNMAGTFDGDGHTIRGVYVEAVYGDGSVGLFSTVSGTVQNLRLQNSYFHHADTTTAKDVWVTMKLTAPIGSIAGTLSGTLDTVYSDAVVKHDGAYVGGLVGVINSTTGSNTIKNSCYAGQVSGTGAVGGILGILADATATIEHCMNAGKITGQYYLGGLCGEVTKTADATTTLTATDCFNVGKLNLQAAGNPWNGGVVGYLKGSTAGVNMTNTYMIGYYADGTNLWNKAIFIATNTKVTYGTNEYTTAENASSTNASWIVLNFEQENYYKTNRTDISLSFQTEGEANTDKYWVARDGKIPMLASFEDLLTNVTY